MLKLRLARLWTLPRSRTLPRPWAILVLAVLLGGCATTTSTQSVGDPADPLKACTANDDCGDGQYCRLALGACAGTGSCELRPEVCTFEFDPVCACDQNTYRNSCGAASEGLSILKPGRCGTDG